jgi:hypothetical protein
LDQQELEELRTDGYRDRKVVRLAVARDLAARHQRPNPHCRLRLKALKPAGIIAGMAAALVSAALDRRAATWKDLRRAGFSVEQIAEYGDDAVAVARGMRPDLDRCRA